jgi:hypothetical protein
MRVHRPDDKGIDEQDVSGVDPAHGERLIGFSSISSSQRLATRLLNKLGLCVGGPHDTAWPVSMPESRAIERDDAVGL